MSDSADLLLDGFNENLAVEIGPQHLPALLGLPDDAHGLVIFAHGSGSDRFSPRNNYVAEQLRHAGLGTLLLDLLTPTEDRDRHNAFDIELLAQRLVLANEWAGADPRTRHLSIGYFGANTGAAAALIASIGIPNRNVSAIVSRGGRPDLAATILPEVQAPTLLLVGGDDDGVLELNQAAYAALHATKQLIVVPGAGHLFEEPGALDVVVAYAIQWFGMHLRETH